MFNPVFSLPEWIASGSHFLAGFECNYQEKVEAGIVEVEGTRFVHTKDISSDPSKKHVFV